MRKTLLSVKFKIPEKADLDKWYLEPITTKKVEEDWKVITLNAEIIHRLWGGSREGWPFNCTLEENYKDLAGLEICASYRQLFSYILRDKKTKEYCGCIYIYPIELFFSEKAKEFDVDFSFFVTHVLYDQGQYPKIFKLLYDWLITSWPFEKSRIFLRNKEIPKKYFPGIIISTVKASRG
jgi:hypothetical protein